MHKMVAANSKPIAVAACHQYSQLVISELHAGGHSQGAAMQRVHAIGIHIAGEVGRAANAADGDHVMHRYPQLDYGFLNSRKNTEITATGAPVGIGFALQVGQGKFSCTLYTGCHRCILLKP
jgi:hypothetical protein